jgi:tetrahydromethanopterin S-methyltransferase subunit F
LHSSGYKLEIFAGLIKEKAKPIVRWGRKATGLIQTQIAGLPLGFNQAIGLFFLDKM